MIKDGIVRMRREINDMEQKKGIILWELTKMKYSNVKKEDNDFLSKLKNDNDLE